jgi:hypothetical protein
MRLATKVIMKTKILGLLVLALAGVSELAGTATAGVVENLDLTFASGATFVGDVTFANDFSSYSAVTGTLYGYDYGTTGYQGTGSDAISWVWYPGSNYSTAGGNSFSNWLMDGTNTSNFSNFITFGYTYTASGITLFTGGLGYGTVNNVDYNDPLVSGTATPVPLPASAWLLLSGLVGVGAMARKRLAA